jgi:hypothetical protein
MSHALVVLLSAYIWQAESKPLSMDGQLDIHRLTSVVTSGIWAFLQLRLGLLQ